MAENRAAPGAQPEQKSPAESLARELEARAYSPAVRTIGLGGLLMSLAAFLRDQERRLSLLEREREARL